MSAPLRPLARFGPPRAQGIQIGHETRPQGGAGLPRLRLPSGLRGLFVLGGANSARQAAIRLAHYGKSVSIVVRVDSLAAGMSHYLIREIEQTPNVRVWLSTEIVGGGGNGLLEHLVLRDVASGAEETVDAGGLFIMIGAHPFTEWLPPEILRDDQSFLMTGRNVDDTRGWPLARSPMFLETSIPAVFAAGDIRQGSVKRVASAVGEGSVAIQLLHELFAAERVQPGGRPKVPTR